MIKISFIVPLYNSAHFLPKCLDSLLRQDIPYQDYEVILVDDGSPDQSKDVAIQYAGNYSNIVVLSQDNKGTSGARNTGLRYARGKYVYFVDPDDYILENSLGIILQKAEKESLDILRFGYTEVDEQYRPTKSCKHPEQPDYSSKVMDGCEFMAERLGIACYVWTYIFRTSLLKDNHLFFNEGDYFDDTPWLPKVLMCAKRVDSIDFKRHFYLIRNDSLVRSNSNGSVEKKIKGQQFVVKELVRQRDECHDKNAKKWYGMMIRHSVLSLLSLVSIKQYAKRGDYLKGLKAQRVFPLSKYKASGKGVVLLALVNLFPELYCLLYHLKQR